MLLRIKIIFLQEKLEENDKTEEIMLMQIETSELKFRSCTWTFVRTDQISKTI